MKTIAIIPARGGSKGIPGKNIMPFCGKPLLAWSILQALATESVEEVYVSSDDDGILAVAEQYGAVPVRRPDELSTDTATSETALLHCLDEAEALRGSLPEGIVFLQCTSPLREPEDIDGAVARFEQAGADSLITTAVLDDLCVWSMQDGELRGLTFDPNNRGRRQDREPMHLENGSIYVFRPDLLRREGNRLGGAMAVFEMAYWKSYEIDTMAEVEICEFFFMRHGLNRLGGGVPTGEDLDLVVYDFDGVMTDNKALVDQNGTESVRVNRSDGLGVKMIRTMGVDQIILSTETNPVVQARAEKLGLSAISGCDDKKTALRDYCEERGIALERVLFVGNDINDLDVMALVGHPAVPADAYPEAKALAKLIIPADGGCGVVRELAKLLDSCSKVG